MLSIKLHHGKVKKLNCCHCLALACSCKRDWNLSKYSIYLRCEHHSLCECHCDWVCSWRDAQACSINCWRGLRDIVHNGAEIRLALTMNVHIMQHVSPLSCAALCFSIFFVLSLSLSISISLPLFLCLWNLCMQAITEEPQRYVESPWFLLQMGQMPHCTIRE